MTVNYLHKRKDFESLIRTLSSQTGILDSLVEKDYWIMHVLYSLKKSGLQFELKGGTSLSKGFQIIDRFSEDIDLHISPRESFKEETGITLNENPNSSSKSAVEGRKKFFDWLADHITIDGITEVTRDVSFDDTHRYRSGGIRLKYHTFFDPIRGLKDGILLEVGFAKVTPNRLVDISSWMYDKAAAAGLQIFDNRAQGIACYHPGYTLVEKLQTIATKYRHEQSKPGGDHQKVNFMRQYYDVFQLLQNSEVQKFIGTDEYYAHKQDWFPDEDLQRPIKENEALLLSDKKVREDFRNRYRSTSNLYYKGQPDFDEMTHYIKQFLEKL
ncbi:nucleotidyl transferase AbiEii/AbiGii toxin family protein [Pararcticibacter amylolyticus]|uniref:Nucleotidyl transferase AbiEii/AbiGii toxin family protein n=1 Tax=Pararcticibacter amylolyticus TaxID=2173175 RepID=A0A2U2PKX5_9SPHI|nr:nucleotidyl transferase AbiEii/AbiGii toxin family protein [Pararcticibacter amylolyticus]PWG81978.1 hypothetical protein DDR33_02840 [Pararcticibacter amylolyticus]